MSITMSELAKLAGVTQPVVSAVLNNTKASRVSAEKRARILALVKETGYVPNLAARQLKGVSNRLVGLITVPSHMGIVTTLQSELISALQRQNYEVLTTQFRDNPDKILRELEARRICGMIALGGFPIQPGLPFCPMVSCGHDSNWEFDISCDKEHGSYEATNHLIRHHGRRKPLFLGIGTPLGYPNQQKYQGMLRALRENGLTIQDDHLLAIPSVRMESAFHQYYDYECIDAEKVVAEVIRRKADALLCANDFIAGRLIPWLRDAGIHIPSDLSVAGYDGYSWTRFASIPLATVIQPLREMAEQAAELLIRQIEGKSFEHTAEGIKVKPRFLPAESCGCHSEQSRMINGIAETILEEN